MIYNMPAVENNKYICYKSDRFLLEDNPNYQNPLYDKINIKEVVTFDCGLCKNLEKN